MNKAAFFLALDIFIVIAWVMFLGSANLWYFELLAVFWILFGLYAGIQNIITIALELRKE